MGSDASQAALKAYGGIKRIAVITPYMPVGDANVHKFFTDTGFEVRRLFGFKCESPTAIAHVSADQLRQGDPRDRRAGRRCDRSSRHQSRDGAARRRKPSAGSPNQWWRSTLRPTGTRCARMASRIRSQASGRLLEAF
ncbi:MAG: hypothetical protein WDO24_27435 [Pseudomonadota bacterium]